MTSAANAVDLLDLIRIRRVELAETRRLRSRGEAGYSDLAGAQYRLALALQAAVDAGLLVRERTVDVSDLACLDQLRDEATP